MYFQGIGVPKLTKLMLFLSYSTLDEFPNPSYHEHILLSSEVICEKKIIGKN